MRAARARSLAQPSVVSGRLGEHRHSRVSTDEIPWGTSAVRLAREQGEFAGTAYRVDWGTVCAVD